MKRQQRNKQLRLAGDARTPFAGRVWMLICVGVIGLATGGWLARTSLRASTFPGAVASDIVEGRAGPWGTLREMPIELHAPEKCDLYYCRTNLPKWCFHADSMIDVRANLLEYGCTEAQTAALMQTVSGEPRDLILTPTLDLVWNLSPEVRRRCYFHLAECPKNPDQMFAFRLKSEEFARRLASAPFAPATKDTLSHLLYRNGDYTYFADEPALNLRLESNDEKLKFMEWRLRMNTMLLTLHVEAGADFKGLAEYWGAGGYSRDVLPIIQALAEKPGGGDVDVVNLLPPFPQHHLYLYPEISEGNHDCIWTTLNFFANTPAETATIGQLEKLWREQCVPISPEQARMGDWVVFTNAIGSIVHSAVYIADDIVFTKNGSSIKMPWVFMKIADVRNTFWQTAPAFVRRKNA